MFFIYLCELNISIKTYRYGTIRFLQCGRAKTADKRGD